MTGKMRYTRPRDCDEGRQVEQDGDDEYHAYEETWLSSVIEILITSDYLMLNVIPAKLEDLKNNLQAMF